MSFFLLSHVMHHNGVDIYGPVQVLERFLIKKKQQVFIAYSPLFFDGTYQETGQKNRNFVKMFPSMVFKYVYDIFFSAQFISSNQPGKEDTVIAVDPLNCIGALFFKPFFQFRLIYYTADFSEQRFNQVILNSVYHLLDKLCLFLSDENWCVSERIVEKRKEQGKTKGVEFVPNTPILPEFKPQIQSVRFRQKLLYVGSMDEQMNIMMLIKAVEKLQKLQPKIQLTLIGGGPLEKQIKSYIQQKKISTFIHYLGPQLNTVVIDQIQKQGIGMALYGGGHLWNLYGDSMKIREYQYFGLPVITTQVPSNSQEVSEYECGVIIESTTLSIGKVIQAIQVIQTGYSSFSQNAYTVTQLRKKEKVLSRLLNPYLEKKV